MAPPSHTANDGASDVHALSVPDSLRLLVTDPDVGLGATEAAHRLDDVGANTLPRVARRGPLLRLTLQFHHPLIYVLLVAAGVTAAIGELVDSSVILAVVVINAVIGFLQEGRAESALDALVSMVRTQATVLRDGTRHRIASEDIVPGDLVVLETGDKVPADLRLIGVDELRIDESALTGESVSVRKATPELPVQTGLGDRTNMAYSGSLVSRGRGWGVVVATGSATEIGHIHRLVGEAQTLETPLTRKLGRFSRILTVVILALAALSFGVGLLHGEPPAQMLTAAVALAVGAIPEGLPAVVTITLAIGVARMARRQAIIRRLPAVETLGSTTVIGTDKTGTLTANAMTVTQILAGGQTFEVTGAGYGPEGEIRVEDRPVTLDEHPALRECLLAGVLCNDSGLTERDGHWSAIGDPTEAALLAVATKAGLDPHHLQQELPRLDAVPFDSERRYMATLHRDGSGRVVAYVKGAVERIAEMATSHLGADGAMAALEPSALIGHTDGLVSDALRVLAFARVELPGGTAALSEDMFDGHLTVLGLQGMVDPPRPEALTAVAVCRDAGIDVKMITGDHAGTARAIAERFGLGTDVTGPTVVTGTELQACPPEDLPGLIARTSVFARVSPEQKLQIVESLQAYDHVVAVTGDGVNDAPALRRSDIGVAMGVSGTEVAKDAADMVLTDDDFASIRAAVEEGRGVFDNLRKFITFILPTSVGQGLVILTAIVLATTLPLLPVQALWVNMTTAVALGLVLAFEPLEPDVMRRPPVPASRPLLTREIIGRIVFVSAIMLIGAFGLFYWELEQGAAVEAARTAVVNVIVLVQIAYLLNCRSLERSLLWVGVFSNRWVGVGITTMIVLQMLFTYTAWMNDLFHSAPIDGQTWLRILGIAVLTYFLVEAEKWARRTVLGSRRAAARQ